jgi:hypothetical protein
MKNLITIIALILVLLVGACSTQNVGPAPVYKQATAE